MEESPFGESIAGTAFFFFTLVQVTLSSYWTFLLISAFSRFDNYRAAFSSSGGNSLFMPYKNVIRMHIMIFVLAFLSLTGLTHCTIYPVLLFYFLPVSTIWETLKPEHTS